MISSLTPPRFGATFIDRSYKLKSGERILTIPSEQIPKHLLKQGFPKRGRVILLDETVADTFTPNGNSVQRKETTIYKRCQRALQGSQSQGEKFLILRRLKSFTQSCLDRANNKLRDRKAA